MKIKAMTYNIQHGMEYLCKKEHKINLDKICEVIASAEPDIVGLNEVYGDGPSKAYTAQAQYIAGKLGMYYYFADALYMTDEGPYGVALLSRFPFHDVKRVLIPDPPVRDEDAYYETRIIIKACVKPDGEPLNVYISHFGLAKSERRSAAAALCAALDGDGTRSVFMGDLNTTPAEPYLSPIRERMSDTSELVCGSKLTFPSDTPEIQIDYIFTRGVTALSAQVLPAAASDHRPYTAELEL